MSLFIMSMLSGNIVLTKFLGICPFMGTSQATKKALGMGISVTFVTVVASIITYLLYHFILVPTDSTYLEVLVFIFVIASLVQMLEIVTKRYFKTLYQALGIYLPLITTNCAVLGVVLLNIRNSYTFLETITYSLGSSLGFTLVIFIFASVREYLDTKEVPKTMKGEPIAFVVAAILSLLFERFVGL